MIPSLPLNKILAALVCISLVAIAALNQYHYITSPDPLVQARSRLFSFSRGDRYFARLQSWYYFAQKGDWSTAAKLESDLYSPDLFVYKSQSQPSEIRKSLTYLTSKNALTVEECLTIARYYLLLNDRPQAAKYVSLAYDQDPVRPDIAKFYLQLSQ
ncbi:MAG: hypothetical protein WC686_04660 [Candidatus Shapirobacteria bacterium]|jgi:hypothetical protein